MIVLKKHRNILVNDSSLKFKRVLDVHWQNINDFLSIEKRGFTKGNAKSFNPIGLLGPNTTRAKILLQNIVWKFRLK